MLNKKYALTIASVVLFGIAIMDLIRGYMHTYNVHHAAENMAGIELSSDSLVLMGAFGISNFLTGFLYFLIIFKAKELVPYVLLLIPLSYMIGGYGLMKISGVVMESPFRGQHMMKIYLSICLLTAIFYFISQIKLKKTVSSTSS
jgi:hypothetical protein